MKKSASGETRTHDHGFIRPNEIAVGEPFQDAHIRALPSELHWRLCCGEADSNGSVSARLFSSDVPCIVALQYKFFSTTMILTHPYLFYFNGTPHKLNCILGMPERKEGIEPSTRRWTYLKVAVSVITHDAFFIAAALPTELLPRLYTISYR